MATRTRKNWWKIALVIVLVTIAGVICFLVWKAYFSGEKSGDNSDSSSVVDDKTKKEEKEEEKKEEQKEEKKDGGEEKEKVPQYDGDDPNVKSGLTGVVTYAGVSGGKLMIRVNIDQYVSNGTCMLGLRREGMNIYSAEARIVDNASTATCEGFDVPVDGLGSGNTQIVIYLNGDDKTGEIAGEVKL